MKKTIYYLSSVLLLVVLAVLFFVVRGSADPKWEKELVDILYESVKAMDAERYIGREFEHLSEMPEERAEKMQTEYTALLESLYADEASIKRCLDVFERIRSLEKPDALRSVDTVRLEHQVRSLDIEGAAAKLSVTWNSCEKVIVENEDGSYTAGFPISQTAVSAVFNETKEGWKLQDFEILDNIIGEEDVSLHKNFPSFEEAYDYAITAEPSIPKGLLLEK